MTQVRIFLGKMENKTKNGPMEYAKLKGINDRIKESICKLHI